MDFRILGPLEVLEGGHQVALGGAKQRALLTTLLLQANEVVSTDRLIDALWEDEPPATAAKGAPGLHLPAAQGAGERAAGDKDAGLRPARRETTSSTSSASNACSSEGRPKEALALWRGQPLSDVAYSRFAQAEIARLEELRLVGAGGADRARPRGRPSRRPRRRAGGARPRAPAARAAARPADARPLPLRAPGGGARGLPGGPQHALRGARASSPAAALRELQQAILNQDPALDASVDRAASRDGRRGTDRRADEPPASCARRSACSMCTRGCRAQTADRSIRRHCGSWRSPSQGSSSRPSSVTVGGSRSVAGDAATAVFGLPAVHEDDALPSGAGRPSTCAPALQRAARPRGARWTCESASARAR